MKSNKGFTLIELLAVIVILAIIALIATPIILGVIDTAKKGSAEASALAYVKAVEDQIVIGQVTDSETTPAIEYPGTYTVAELTTSGVNVKGTLPANTDEITLSDDGSVVSGTKLNIKVSGTDYCATYTISGTTGSVEVANGECAAADESQEG